MAMALAGTNNLEENLGVVTVLIGLEDSSCIPNNILVGEHSIFQNIMESL